MKRSLQHKECDMRSEIVLVAERLFGDVGFEKTTVADIAGVMRMSAANVYRFFSSKAEINQEVARRLLSTLETKIIDGTSHVSSCEEKLRMFVAVIEKAHVDRFRYQRKFHDLIEVAFDERWPAAVEHGNRLIELLSAIISQGNKDGAFYVSDCDLTAILVSSACIRFWHPRLAIESAQEPEPTLDQIIDFCLSALGNCRST